MYESIAYIHFVCVNKYDLNEEMTDQIEEFCRSNHIHFVGQIPYDEVVTKAMVNGKNIIEYSNGKTAQRIKNIWQNIEDKI